MHTNNAWGGSFDVSMDSATDDDRSRNLDLDRASLQKLEETHQSWLLGPAEQKKNQYVDFGCVVCSRKLLKKIGWVVLAGILLIGFIVMIVKLIPRRHPPAPPEDTYTQALHKVLLFFNAQKSGALPKSNGISWRANSALNDGGETVDLEGGYYDAGDNIKFHFPAAYTLTILSWSVIEYSAKYEAAGELDHVKDLIKWGTDYMLKTFNKSAPSIDTLYAQVGVATGSGENDHSCWERPEDMDYPRPVAQCGRCSDLVSEMAAALSAASIVFKDNREYSETLRHGAEILFAYGRSAHGFYSESVPDAANFYNSTNYYDEYIWGAAWLYFATGNSSYLQLATTSGIAKNAGATGGSLDSRVFSWDNKLPGAQLILTRLRIMMNPGYPFEDLLRLYNNETNIGMCSYLPVYKTFNVTKGGLVQLNRGRPAPLQYNAGAAFLAAVYADYLRAADVPGWTCGPTFLDVQTLRNFSRSQIDYILGKNPNKMSYVVGFGPHYPTHVHHRAASIPRNVNSKGCTTADAFLYTKSANPHLITGAMVGGPDSRDRFADVRSNYNFTEPTIAGNALLTAALIALSGGDSGTIDTNTLFAAIPPLFPPAPPPPAAWKP